MTRSPVRELMSPRSTEALSDGQADGSLSKRRDNEPSMSVQEETPLVSSGESIMV